MSTAIAVANQLHAQRLRVLEEAVSWLGTPFMHAQRMRSVGVDCAQLLLACYCDTGIIAPIDPGQYSPDWYRHENGERFSALLEHHCMKHLVAVPGDIVTFVFGRGESHAAIYEGSDVIIHAKAGRGVVRESIAKHTPLRARYASAWTPLVWAS